MAKRITIIIEDDYTYLPEFEPWRSPYTYPWGTPYVYPWVGTTGGTYTPPDWNKYCSVTNGVHSGV